MAWALAISGVAIWATDALARPLGQPFTFAVFPSVALVAIVAGTGAGSLAAVLYTAAFAYLYFPPIHLLVEADHPALIRLTGNLLSNLLIAVISGALRTVLQRQLRLRAEAEAGRDEMSAVLADLRKLQEAREDFLRTLSHDIRTPLNVIVTHAELLLREHVGGPASVIRRGEAIRGAAWSVTAMLGDVIETVQIESGQMKLARDYVDVAALAHGLKARLEGTLPTQRLELAIPPELPKPYADPARLERVLVNLLSNAFKYGADAPVTLSAEGAGDEILLRVRDHGPGIANGDLKKIFDRFYRSPNAGKAEGLGLGLYISRLLVEAHQGRIWAESGGAGTGTTFFVALPVQAARLPSGSERSSSEASLVGR
jgi:signal transduction histidine kinase